MATEKSGTVRLVLAPGDTSPLAPSPESSQRRLGQQR
jgi:hypothetical protein